MLKKLRIKLICASMFSLFTVLTIILGIAGALNYQNLVTNADNILQILAENDGRFPEPDKTAQDRTPPQTPQDGMHRLSPELPYESRYFSVFLDKDGNVTAVNTGKIAAVDTSAAMQYGEDIWKSGSSSGFVDSYRYTVSASGDETHVIFLDCGRNLTTFYTFMITCTVVSLVGLLAVFLLLLVLSEHIVKPFSETYEKQKQFITDAGHELKTPLTIIDADAEVLSMDLGDNEWLSDIQNQTKRLADLTNNLILLARMEEEQPQIQAIEFPLSDVAEETAAAFQTLARTQHKSLSCRIQPMLSLVGDEKTLRQLFSILLDNAVKYSNPGGAISFTLERQKGMVRLTVTNTADFVPRDSLPHFFDRFYRGDPSRNSRTGGYGLGLSIAAAIVTAHKGKIWASTDDEASLTITVTLPA
ncbi:MAG: sensor histidine kinase [Acutalibacter sp.]|jgi:two-component system sensor histidine kinase CiaH